jgi:hypothetical protein
MDPFKQMRDAGAHSRIASDAAGVIAKAAKARQARWKRENELARRQATVGPASPNAVDPTSEWPMFLLFIGLFLALVVVAMLLVPRLNV